MLSLSPRSIQNYIATKKIPARKVGRRTLILVRDLEEFLRKDQPSPLAAGNTTIRAVPTIDHYSARSAMIGSILQARRAGR